MADPSLQSLCCRGALNKNVSRQLSLLEEPSYHGVSVFSAGLGIVGASYQLSCLIRSSPHRFQHSNSGTIRTNSILFWLAFSDLLASTGVLSRSLLWLTSNPENASSSSLSFDAAMCACISGFIQYLYMCTHMWTLMYAVDAKRIAHELAFRALPCHLSSWGIPAILTILGLSIMYSSGLECSKLTAFEKLLPNYVISYATVAVTLVTLPILLTIALTQAEAVLINRFARYTLAERRVIDLLKRKYQLIAGGFLLCWTPNIVNACILWTSWEKLPYDWVAFNWYLMGILNPLQGLLNVFLYRRKSYKPTMGDFRELISSFNVSLRDAVQEQPDEETPLLL